MPNLTGTSQAFVGDTSAVDTSANERVGKRAWDEDGNEYIYLKGVASTAAGSWVVFDEDYATTLLTANEVGPVAIAMAAIDATTKFGWYQIFGVNTVAKTDTVAADSSLYIDGTAGRADDLGVSGDLILNAYSMTADTSNVATVWIGYPSVSNDVGGGGSGDVSGPASSTDNAIARFDGTGGKTIQNSVVTIADTNGNMAGVGTLSSGAITSTGDSSMGSLTLTTDLAITEGGTGASVAATALSNLGGIGAATTDTLTNKTINADGTGNSITNIENADIKAAAAIAVNKLAALTASEIAGTDASGFLTSLAAATYPSLTELTYVKGVTSAIQTQLGLKAPLASPTFTGTVTLPVGLTGVLRADTGVVATDTDVTDIVTAASLTAAGKVELATAAETTTGTDATRAVTPDGLAGSDYGKRVIGVLAIDPATAMTTGSAKVYYRIPAIMNGWNLVDVEAQMFGTGTTSVATIQVRNVTDAVNMLSTGITIDSAEKDSSTAVTAPVIDTAADDVATADQIAIDVNGVHSSAGAGLYVEMVYSLP